MDIHCRCGAQFNVPESYVGKTARCAACKSLLHLTAGTLSFSVASAGDFEAMLVVEAGPQHVGQQYLLGGNDPIEIGKLESKPICLPGVRVSRNHCRLVRAGETSWNLEDQASTNGSIVNGHKVSFRELQHGDELQVGEYRLRYVCEAALPVAAAVAAEGDAVVDGPGDLYDVAEPPPAPAVAYVPPVPLPQHQMNVPPAGASGPVCPSCQRKLGYNAKICTACGINIKSGRPIIMAHGLDENDLEIKAQNTLAFLSWIIPVGPFYPIASEAYGSHKPWTVRSIAIITLIASVAFWIGWFASADDSDDPYSTPNGHLMLWPPGEVKQDADLTALIDVQIGLAEEAIRKSKGGRLTNQDRQRLDELRKGLVEEVRKEMQNAPQFRWYQLITHAFLHGDIMHIAGNLLFLLVFGSRVNALIGNIATPILYPILGVAAAAAHLFFEARPGIPMLGASGAIMGLAGMYFVFFPVHKVHMVAWWRWGLVGGFRLSYKVWAMRGFWVVLFYLAFDVVATIMGSEGGVAHWAHLGGFLVGMAFAFILLCSRLLNARGGDLFSVMLGRYAWPLIGKPSRWNEAAAAA